MGTYLSQPITQKKINTQNFNYNRIIVTSCQMQGWRKQMEDASIVLQLIQNSIYLFGIFDGHGGPEVAQFVAKYLPKQLINQPYFKLHNYSKAFKNAFKKIDQILQSNKGQTQLKKLSQKATVQVQRQPKQKISAKTGATANIILITKQKIICANIGDSRSVLCKKGKAIPLSIDHKPTLQHQKQRILKAGCKITEDRINNGLNLSRSFGDFSYKSSSKLPPQQQAIISIPEIKQFDRSSQDEFIIMGCDGIWQRYINKNQQMIEKLIKLNTKYSSQSKNLRKKSYHIETNDNLQQLTKNLQDDKNQIRNRKKTAFTTLSLPKLQTKQQLMFNTLFNQLIGDSTQNQIGYDNMSAILIQFSYQF